MTSSEDAGDRPVSTLYELFPTLSAGPLTYLMDVDMEDAIRLVKQVLEEAPICRHFMENGCYRSDCRYSHNLDVTCKFWLRGNCRNNQCSFKHGWTLPPRRKPVAEPLKPTTCTLQTVPQTVPQAVPRTIPQIVPQTVPQTVPQAAPRTVPQIAHQIAPQNVPQSVSQHRPQLLTQPASSVAGTYAAALVSPASRPPVIVVPKAVRPETVPIPADLWVEERDPQAFQIPDPLERFRYVEQHSAGKRSDVLDLHYQSTRTAVVVLEALLPERLKQHGSVWVATGTGHHVVQQSHQRKGGLLLQVVQQWLREQGYSFKLGVDGSGHSGAVLVTATKT